MGPNTITFEMAQSARDKLQASAREIWTSIRNESMDSSNGQGQPSADGTMTMSFEKIEAVLKAMFGSCTTGVPPNNNPQEPTTCALPCEQKRSRSTGTGTRSRDFVSSEHVYAQLFEDDQAKASRAVNGLRERAASTSPRSKFSNQFRDFPKTKSTPTPGRLTPAPPPPPPSTRAVNISADLSFDDGISAISANTLEEMAKVHEFRNQTRLTSKHAISNVEDISYKHANRSRQNSESKVISPRQVQSIMAPVKFTRGPSMGTHTSRATRSSKGTKSTSSTQDSEFASVWRKEERKYWDDVVAQNKVIQPLSGPGRHPATKKSSRRRSQSGSYSTKDVTVTTTSSSSFSSHPHDVIQFDRKDLVGSTNILSRNVPLSSLDRGRIQTSLQVPYDSELGEI
ncbi:expressed unknown protein [Seminavis robusta]|uniref:Uncharacterized protein n=1 Tax=Seminavis robusta TaxID=568900 RepID=A0A9N8DP27_9STRA|nr:expressed unknown protein [Seminavis robusta]|eukprot:Sro246_g097890.1 n/a (398) ;mRNA; f:80414-81699